MTIVCAGRLYCDFIFTDLPRWPSLGTEIFAGGFGIHAGGGAFITGAHLADLGQAVALATVTPRAPMSQLLASALAEARLDLSLCTPLPPGADPQVTVALGHAGDRAFVTRRSGPPCPDLDGQALAALGATHLHIGELATLVEKPGLIAQARQAGMTVSLDCGWDDGLSGQDVSALLPQVDVFLPNAEEAAHLERIGVARDLAPLTVTKRGALGSSAEPRSGTRVDVPARPLEALDTTGAGDAFNAGFLTEWLDGTALPRCLAAGNARGAMAIRHRGGFRTSA